MYDVFDNPEELIYNFEESGPEDAPMEELIDETNKMNIGDISSINRCNSKYAKRLCIFDSFYKFYAEDHYDIGGCYTGNRPDLWFYYTTTVCPEQVYLLNLFACQRRVGTFALGISNSNELSYTMLDDTKTATLPNSLTWYHFQSTHSDQSHYVKTFSFDWQQKLNLQNTTLYIPIAVTMKPTFSLNTELIDSIKLEHNTKKMSSLETENFLLISATGTKFPVHKIIIAAHSTKLREMLKESNSSLRLEESDKEVELIIEYLYTGVIKDISKYDLFKLFEISHKYELMPLFNIIKYVIAKNINAKNAVEVALVAKKYDLDELLFKVFNFIKKHSEVLFTDGWKNLNDVELAKALFQYSQRKE